MVDQAEKRRSGIVKLEQPGLGNCHLKTSLCLSFPPSLGRGTVHWLQSHPTSCCTELSLYFFATDSRAMNWVQRKIYLYNVTFGLYMLDWWERYLFNTLVVVLMWFIFYNGSRYVTEFCKRHLW
ncbi:unnamed protein product [Prunus armeniaca]